MLSCNSIKIDSIRLYFKLFQPIVKTALPILVDPLLNLLRTLHLEVQYEGNKISTGLYSDDIIRHYLGFPVAGK